MGDEKGQPASVSLGRRLRTLRQAAGVSYEQARAYGFGSKRTVMRREKGEGPYSSIIVREMCVKYGASVDETNELSAIADRIKDERILEDRPDLLPPEFGVYVDFESRARELFMYQPLVLPGLLQTGEYARAVYEAVRPSLSREDVDKYVRVRIARRKIVFDEGRSVELHVVVDQGALERARQVAADQLEHLHLMVANGNVSVSVLPFMAGAHAGMAGSFTLLRGDPDVVYVESFAGAQLLYQRPQVKEFEEVFASLRAQSIPIGEFAPWVS
jgi:transcriptional regulator with XRE-family HTH domain